MLTMINSVWSETNKQEFVLSAWGLLLYRHQGGILPECFWEIMICGHSLHQQTNEGDLAGISVSDSHSFFKPGKYFWRQVVFGVHTWNLHLPELQNYYVGWFGFESICS